MSKRHYTSVQKNDDGKLREALERVIHVEDSIARINNKTYHKELLRAIPLKQVFGRLSEYENQLARLTYVDEMSPKEIASRLEIDDVSRITRDISRLRNKIRSRVRTLLSKDRAANELMLGWQRIHDKRHRAA